MNLSGFLEIFQPILTSTILRPSAHCCEIQYLQTVKYAFENTQAPTLPNPCLDESHPPRPRAETSRISCSASQRCASGPVKQRWHKPCWSRKVANKGQLLSTPAALLDGPMRTFDMVRARTFTRHMRGVRWYGEGVLS
jgi:hypothetical protein